MTNTPPEVVATLSARALGLIFNGASLRPAVIVWRFDDAPAEFQALSTNGGDEDWLAFVPRQIWEASREYIPWIEAGGPFGCHDVQWIDLPGGNRLAIGCHA